VLETGIILLGGDADRLMSDDMVKRAYLGAT
jgi:ABC-type lipopolysaccharide export system ATPase subunit